MLRIASAGLTRRAVCTQPRAQTLLARAASGRFLSTEPPKSEEPKPEEPKQEEPSAEASAEPTPEGEAAAAGAEEITQLQERITELEAQVEKKHDQLLRAMADSDNARRRAVIDVENAHKFGMSKFAKSLLDVADNLNRAADSVPDELRGSEEVRGVKRSAAARRVSVGSQAHTGAPPSRAQVPALAALYDGVVMTESLLIKAFAEHGLVKIWPEGEKFDPNVSPNPSRTTAPPPGQRARDRTAARGRAGARGRVRGARRRSRSWHRGARRLRWLRPARPLPPSCDRRHHPQAVRRTGTWWLLVSDAAGGVIAL